MCASTAGPEVAEVAEEKQRVEPEEDARLLAEVLKARRSRRGERETKKLRGDC